MAHVCFMSVVVTVWGLWECLLCIYMRQNAIMEKSQSAYNSHRSTETALLRVYNDVMLNIDRGNGTLLVYWTCGRHLIPSAIKLFSTF